MGGLLHRGKVGTICLSVCRGRQLAPFFAHYLTADIQPSHVWYDTEIEGQPFWTVLSKDVLKVKELVFFLTVLPLFALHATNLTNYVSQALWSLQYPQSLMRCISNQKITPQKSEMMKALSACTVGRRGMEGKGERVSASHSFSCSVFGASTGSLGFMSLLPSSCLHFWLPYSLCCFSSLSLFPCSLSPTLYPSLSGCWLLPGA